MCDRNISPVNPDGIFKSAVAGSGFNPFDKQALVFTCLQNKSFENTVGKGEIALYEQFLLFPQCFLPVWRTFCHFHQFQHCCLQTFSVWKSLKYVLWERVKLLEGILDEINFNHTIPVYFILDYNGRFQTVKISGYLQTICI